MRRRRFRLRLSPWEVGVDRGRVTVEIFSASQKRLGKICFGGPDELVELVDCLDRALRHRRRREETEIAPWWFRVNYRGNLRATSRRLRPDAQFHLLAVHRVRDSESCERPMSRVQLEELHSKLSWALSISRQNTERVTLPAALVALPA